MIIVHAARLSEEDGPRQLGLSPIAPIPIREGPPIHSNRLAVWRIVWFGEVHLLWVFLKTMSLLNSFYFNLHWATLLPMTSYEEILGSAKQLSSAERVQWADALLAEELGFGMWGERKEVADAEATCPTCARLKCARLMVAKRHLKSFCAR